MKDLPPNVRPYKRTPEFTELSVPRALLRSHSTKSGTWGKIVVLKGRLTYRILEPDIEEMQIDSTHPGVIEPAVRHEIEPRGEVRFYVQFYSQPIA
ncbi:MAG: DUF1971 domain-containing protein [Gammaproteobacteria bacterium]|nr:DUF1971 domain-containing protein [Gammaproteobacteria bacterium]